MSWNESCGLSTVAAHHIGGQDGCIRGRASQAMSILTYLYEGEWFLFLIDKVSISGCHADVGPRGKKQVLKFLDLLFDPCCESV